MKLANAVGDPESATARALGEGSISTEHAGILARILDAMTAPRRAHTHSTNAQGGTPGERRDHAHQRGLAFAELIEHLPGERLHPRTAATLVIHVDLDILHGARRTAGLDTDQAISGAEATRLACTADTIVMSLKDGHPVNLDRTHRLFSEKQRLALGATHTGTVLLHPRR